MVYRIVSAYFLRSDGVVPLGRSLCRAESWRYFLAQRLQVYIELCSPIGVPTISSASWCSVANDLLAMFVFVRGCGLIRIPIRPELIRDKQDDVVRLFPITSSIHDRSQYKI